MVKMLQMVYDCRNVSDGCQMVYDGVGWLYREGLSDGEVTVIIYSLYTYEKYKYTIFDVVQDCIVMR
jgi:hypothetical protein